MARKPAPKLDENALTKGELRKLNGLRKSVGEDVGEKAFVEWLRKKPAVMAELEDKNAVLIADTVERFFFGLNAKVELTPVMNGEDLHKALSGVPNIVENYG